VNRLSEDTEKEKLAREVKIFFPKFEILKDSGGEKTAGFQDF